MRIVFNPIYISKDGEIDRTSFGDAVMCLDPDNLTAEGIELSRRYWTNRSQDVMARIAPLLKDPAQLLQKANEYAYPYDALLLTKEKRALFLDAINKLPRYLKSLLDQEDMTLICGTISGGYTKGYELYNLQAIIIDSKPVYYSNPGMDISEITDILKEETYHYFDRKTGFSASTAFQDVSNKLKTDIQKMAALEQMLTQVHGQHAKPKFKQYDSKDFYAELLVEYFHMRNYLATEHLDEAKLVELFGSEVSSLCKQFEERLIEMAHGTKTREKAIRTGP